ncbi:hypothetical protein NDU88_004022 [Pleurodeles waltl]|uniref:Uncharacterized protein n=1 Tax=Pleurodeles waltl TaxID=8319 RepID=A0AAV7RGW2_PLEWA|nr:hypothetical protein NDU88_004022 [Pleurodeles waltl]
MERRTPSPAEFDVRACLRPAAGSTAPPGLLLREPLTTESPRPLPVPGYSPSRGCPAPAPLGAHPEVKRVPVCIKGQLSSALSGAIDGKEKKRIKYGLGLAKDGAF